MRKLTSCGSPSRRVGRPRPSFLFAALLLVGACEAEPEPVQPDPEVPITWDTPLHSDWVGQPLSPTIEGRSLREIVSGQVDARGEGRTCTACHFDQSITLYRPEYPQWSVEDIGPYDILDGRTWAGRTGWAAIFERQHEDALVEKPPELREAFRVWREAEAARTEPLGWTDPVSEERIGVPPDPAIADRTLDDVINSRVSGRPDDLLCSACHYRDASIPYRPDIEQDASSAFGPDTVVDGRTWAGAGGWAIVFTRLGGNGTFHKPDYLRATLFKWYDDGSLD